LDLNPAALLVALQKDLNRYLTYDDVRGLHNPEYVLPPEVSTERFRAFALGRSAFKKFISFTRKDADEKALSKFLACNDACARVDFTPETLVDEFLLGQFRHEMYRFCVTYLDDIHIHDVADAGSLGPGSNIGAKSYDFYTKMFNSPLSVVDIGLYHRFKAWTLRNPNWLMADHYRSSVHGVRTVVGNKLSFVPKNEEISRTICTEPTLNMWYQLGLGSLINRGLERKFGINLENQQSKNREMAQLGSIFENRATIDLESASDSVSLKLCETFLTPAVMALVEAFRSPTTTLPNGKVVTLHMVSSMGCGFTFALQTMIFACVVSAVYRMLDIRLQPSTDVRIGNFGVNGDDIICTHESDAYVKRLLHLLGFKVNAAKSFNSGFFRESCGADFYKGVPVRGVYIKALDTEQDAYVTLNRLGQWCAEGQQSLPATMAYLYSCVRKLYVPLWESDDAGIKVPYKVACERLRRDKNGTLIYKRWVPRPLVVRITDDDVVYPQGVDTKPRRSGSNDLSDLRLARRNVFGLYLTLLRGDIRAYKMSLRPRVVKYELCRSLAPCWDRLPTAQLAAGHPTRLGRASEEHWTNVLTRLTSRA